MKIIDIESSSELINPYGFNVIPDTDYPFTLLGFQLKNAYDQQRHFIPKHYNPVDIVHFVHTPEFTPLFFRGIPINATHKLSSLIQAISQKQFYKLGGLDNLSYNNILKETNLTCNECWSYLRPGVYPIDSIHLNELSTDKLDINNIYNEIFTNKDIPYFQSISYITIYILDNKNIVNINTHQTLKKLVADYKKQAA